MSSVGGTGQLGRGFGGCRTFPTVPFAPFWMITSPGWSSTNSSTIRNADGGLPYHISELEGKQSAM